MAKPKLIKERIRKLFPKANLSQSRINALAVKLSKKLADDADEEAIDKAVNDFNEIYSFEDIAKEDDRVRSLEKKAKKNQKPSTEDPEDEDDEEEEDEDVEGGKSKKDKKPNPDEMPAWAKKLVDSNEALTQKVADLQTGKIVEAKTADARKIFDEIEAFKGLSDSMKNRLFKTIDVNSEDETIEDQLTTLEEDYTESVQSDNDSKAYPGTPPTGGDAKKVTDEEVEDIVDDL